MQKTQIKWWTRPFVVFSILLLLKMFVSHYIIFGSLNILKLLITALPTIWVILLLLEFFMRKRKLLGYMIVNLLISSILFATMVYEKYFGVIVNHHAFKQMGQVSDVKSSIVDMLQPAYFIVFIDIIVILGLLLFIPKVRKWGKSRLHFKRKSTLIVLAVSFFILVTNMVSKEEIVNEYRMAEEMGTLNYQIYRMVTGATESTVEASSITQDAVMELKGIQTLKTPEHYGEAADKNLIMIQLESFQDFLLNLKVGDQEITPVLNDLLEQSYYFPNFYQQIGQGNTSDAEYLVNTSLYPAPDGAASQMYSHKELPGLPRLLNDEGYKSVTFHANDVTFWDRNRLYPSLGFDQYYDSSFFGKEDVISFGASDEVLYEKTADELEKLHQSNQKFYSHVISMTNHHPFELPASKNPMSLPEEYENTMVGNYYRTAHYADYALGQFIDQLKESGIWENSIIVIYGDHSGLASNSLSEGEKQMMNELSGRDYGYADMYNVPLIISIPGVSNGAVYEQLGGQIDVMPTIANLMGVSLENQIYFGQDLLNNDRNLLPMRYYLPSGSFINSESIFVPGKGVEDGTATPLKLNSTITDDKQLSEDYYNAIQLLKMSDSYVQSLPDRQN
jgi:lipoteichoic acid synthase